MFELSFGGRVAQWAEDRNLIEGSNPRKQMTKLFEECEELSHALQDDDMKEVVDAIGDIQVVLAVMCAQMGLCVDTCRDIAWNEIKDRKGKIVDGVFVKEVQMDKPNDGGPAFPCVDAKGFVSEGMSIRDYFAGQALASMDTDGCTLIGMQSIVQRAYCLADAMLAEREKERE